MIVFDLACHLGHRFEGWFASATDFTSQKEQRLVSCPSCSSARVERVPSATRINVLGTQTPVEAQAARPDAAQFGVEMAGGRDPVAVAQMLFSRLVDQILTHTEDVGRDFPAEARRIFHQEAEARPIRGVASPKEHDALVDEGIPVARLPIPPSGSWN